MKKRLLAMLLAMLMVLGTLPMTVFAADDGETAAASDTVTEIADTGAVATKDGEKVVLANHKLPGDAPWDSASLKIDSVIPAAGDAPRTVNLTLSVSNLQEHENGTGEAGKWIGIGVPFKEVGNHTVEKPNYLDGSAFYWGFGEVPDYEDADYSDGTTQGFVAGGWSTSQQVTVDGDKYIGRYWNLATLPADTNKGYIVVKDPTVADDSTTTWTYTVYDITFNVTLGAAKVYVTSGNPGDNGLASVTAVGPTSPDANGVQNFALAEEKSIPFSLNHVGVDGWYGYWVGVGIPAAESQTGRTYYLGATSDAFTVDKVKGMTEDEDGIKVVPATEFEDEIDGGYAMFWPNLGDTIKYRDKKVTVIVKDGNTYTTYNFDFSKAEFEAPTISDVKFSGDVATAMANGLQAGSVLPQTVSYTLSKVNAGEHYFTTLTKGDKAIGSAIEVSATTENKGYAFSLLNKAQMELWPADVKASDFTGECTLTVYTASKSAWGASGSVTFDGEKPVKSGVVFTEVATTSITVTPDVIAANLVDQDDPTATGLGTVTVTTGDYSHPVNGGTVDWKTIIIPVTVKAENVKLHTASADAGKGYWVGIGVPSKLDGDTYAAGWGEYPTDTAVFGSANRDSSQTYDQDYATFYFDASAQALAKNSNKGYVAVRSGTGENIVTVIYKITFDTVTRVKADGTVNDDGNIATVGKQTVVLGQLVDHDDTDPKTDLAETYEITKIELDANGVVNVTVRADDLKQHKNGADDDGYWVGIGIPKPANGAEIRQGWGDTEGTVQGTAGNPSKDGQEWVKNGTLQYTEDADAAEYWTYYFNVTKEKDGQTGFITVKNGTVTTTYKITFNVTRAGTVYADNTLAPANLTYSAADGATAPNYGHVDTYTVTNTGKTITITATNLEKTTNAATPPVTAYWVGVALPKQVGYTYAKGFGTKPTTVAADAYKALTTTQTVENDVYVTTYWGWSTAAKATAAEKGWLSVKDGEGNVVNYTVTFDITPKVVVPEVVTTVKPAILNGGSDSDPKGGNAINYGATIANQEITLTVTGLKKTQWGDPGQTGTAVTGGIAYVTGVALPKQTDVTYAWGFGTLPNDAEYTAVTRTQHNGEYVTFYFMQDDQAGWTGKTGYISVKSESGGITTYTITFDVTVAALPTVVVAPIVDHNDPPKADLGTVTKSPVTDVANKANTYAFTLTGTNIKEHQNALGKAGYWVGFGMPIDNATGAGYTYYPVTDGTEGAVIDTIPGRVYEDDGKNYNTVYFDEDGEYTIVQKKNGTAVATYVVTVVIDKFPEVVVAPIADHSATPIPTADLGTVSVNIAKTETAKTYEVTLTGTNIAYHENANHDGGTWVGFGMPIDSADGTDYTYTLKAATADDEDTILASVPGRVHTVGTGENAKYYNTVYFSENGTYTIEQTKGGTTITYVVTVVITAAQGNAYTQDDIAPANLTYAEDATPPEYGHVKTYKTELDGKTITITANGLEMTTNAATPPATAYWVGLALKKAAGVTYATGFGTKPTTVAADAYKALTTTQTVDGVEYVTTYWGWGAADKIADNNTGWLSVKDAKGAIVNYTVEFVITVPVTVTVTPDEDGKIVVDDNVVATLIDAALAASQDDVDPDIIEGSTVLEEPVATIKVTKAEGATEDLTEASVAVSVEKLETAADNGVSVALEVEGVGSITLDPDAIKTALADNDSTVLTLEVAKVANGSLETPDGVSADDILASFTASVLDENDEPVKDFTGGTITLVFKTGIDSAKQKDYIDVYQDGDPVPDTKYNLFGGKLTLTVDHLSEFVITAADEKQDPPTPTTPTTPTIPATGSTYSVANGSGSADGGSWSTDKTSAAAGSTVTITVTPAEGYRADKVTVKDAQGNDVAVTKTKDGKYTFTMPSSKVDVSVSFAALIVFTDVEADAYYADAVAWAVANGITNGMGNDKFVPNGPCTRAQIVTFLWRAMGSPEVDTPAGFTDVKAGSYYEKAVAWAVANGITNGTGDNKFSPDEPCTRAQAVTLLWRAEKMPESSGDSSFDDVRADAYYADAVAWAVANEITNGTGNNNFSPKLTCTRAQIVTFLYRDMA